MTPSTGVIGALGVMGFGIAIAILRWPELGTLMTAALLYLNLLPIGIRLHGVPPVMVAGAALLVAPALFQYLAIRRERPIIDRPFLLMLLFLACVIASSSFAKVRGFAIVWIVRYVGEGLLVYFLFLNLIRSTDMLRRVTWLLVLCGGLLATFTVYQEFTGSYRNNFGGLAGRNLEFESDGGQGTDRTSVRLANRAQGPIDDPNRYAQLLIVLLPLAWCLITTSASRMAKSVAMTSSALIVAAVLLTYSRGGFVGLVLMVALMGGLRMIPVRYIAAATVTMALSVAILNPGYADRMRSLLGIGGLFSGPSTSGAAPDAVERGRATHMLAAWRVFLDHPILGTGPGQFAGVYSVDYSSELYSVRRVTEPRRAHSMYLELAAETGIIGFSVFMAIVIMTLSRLVKAWRATKHVDPFISNMSLASVVAVFAYLATATFLQLSFQRYYWFLLALAGATVRLAELRPAAAREPAPVRSQSWPEPDPDRPVGTAEAAAE